jgi:hypothetical protein
MAVTSYAEVLKAAQHLPLDDQVELAEALLRNLRSALPRELVRPAEKELALLGGMSVEELRVLAEADQVALLKARARYTLMARR